MKPVALACLVAVALAGCAGVPAPADETAQASAPVNPPVSGSMSGPVSPPPIVPTPAPAIPFVNSQAGELVAYFSAVARLPASAQKRELAQAALVFGREGTPYSRLKLGGLHAQPVAGLRDDARALLLLEPLAARGREVGADERPLADIAVLLYAQVAERQRLVREEARKQDALREQLREETRKQDALRERLEALKSIERSILQREERPRPAPR